MDPPDLSSITVLVDLELKRLEDSRREQGWTPWILLAALAALSWQLVEYVAASPHWQGVGLYWSILIVVGLTVESMIDLLNSNEGPRRPGLRYFRLNLFAAGRSARLFAALKIGGAAVLLCWLTPLSGLIKGAWLVLFGYYVYVLFAHVAGSWTDFPHPVGTMPQGKKYSWLIPVLVWILHLSLVVTAMVGLWPRLVASYNVADAQVALLGFAVAHLSSLLLGFRANEPLRQELIHLRRVIGLGELAAEQAQQKLFELLYGSELLVLLRPRFEMVEQNLEGCASLHGKAEAALRVLAHGDGPRSEAMAGIKEAEERFDAAECEWVALHVRVVVCRLIGGVPEDVSTWHAALKSRIAAEEDKLKAFRAAIKNLPRGDDEDD